MNFEYFIAKRLHFSSKKSKKNVSRPAVRVATIGIAIGLAVMIIAVSVVIGFKTEVGNQVIGFGSHIQVSALGSQTTYDRAPITLSEENIAQIAQLKNVKTLQRIATKPGIIKTDDAFQGVVLKGVDSTFDWAFFHRNMIEGDTLTWDKKSINQGAIISQNTAHLLNLKLGDSFQCYFMQEQVRARKFTIQGIYATTFAEYDKLFLLTDIRSIQRLNGWDSLQISTLEILIDDFDYIDRTASQIHEIIGNRFDEEGLLYQTRTIEQLTPQIFDWLDRLDVNAWAILFLMTVVAGFNMISGLFILILERTNTIGVLKALGTQNWSIRKVFLYHAIFLVAKGMLWGNIIGAGIILIQYFTHLLPLDPDIYYVNFVPVSLNGWYLLALNLGTLIASITMLIGPSYLITKITPAKAIKFD